MKRVISVFILLYSAFTFGSFSVSKKFSITLQEKPIAIVTASYNNKKWYKFNLDSVIAQAETYENFHLYYIDDCSTDGTFELVKNYIEEKGFSDKVTLIHNAERRGALANQYRAVHMCSNDTIITILDGDDWLAHNGVLRFINNVYSKEDIWLTYGQFKEFPSNCIGFCREMPKRVVLSNSFRKHPDIPSHLRTFYAGLFKQIKKEDLMLDGDFFKMTGDAAAMIPMIEMARDHFKFIPQVLLIYNAANDLNDHKVSKALQRRIDLIIRSLTPYNKIVSPF